jgi:ribosomal protein S18 acetylase RimI-like enzyme
VSRTSVRIRRAREADLAEVVRIDALRSGLRKPGYWRRVISGFRGAAPGAAPVVLAAEADGGGLAGCLLGEIRAFEFGSEPCGWLLAVSVDPGFSRAGVATGLLEEACRRFRAAGVTRVRTMVGRNDVPFQSFFRSRGFVGGPFVQLERDLAVPE